MIDQFNFYSFNDKSSDTIGIEDCLEAIFSIKINKIKNTSFSPIFREEKTNVLLINALYPEEYEGIDHSFNINYPSSHVYFPFCNSVASYISKLSNKKWKIVINLSEESFKVKTEVFKQFIEILLEYNTCFKNIFFLNNDFKAYHPQLVNSGKVKVQFLNFPFFLIQETIAAKNLNLNFNFARNYKKYERVIFPNLHLKPHKLLTLLEFYKQGLITKTNFSAIVGSFKPDKIDLKYKQSLEDFLLLAGNKNYSGDKKTWNPTTLHYYKDSILKSSYYSSFQVKNINGKISSSVLNEKFSLKNRDRIREVLDSKSNYHYLFLGSELCIQSETEYKENKNICPITEKTFLPMRLGVSSVTIGCRETYKHLKNLGFYTYEDYLNFSFDSDPDEFRRINAVEYTKRLLPNLNSKEIEEIDRFNFNLFSDYSLIIKYLNSHFFKSIL